jgi:hypothetical protein
MTSITTLVANDTVSGDVRTEGPEGRKQVERKPSLDRKSRSKEANGERPALS